MSAPTAAQVAEQITEISARVQEAADLFAESHMDGDSMFALEAFQKAVVTMRSIRLELDGLAESFQPEVASEVPRAHAGSPKSEQRLKAAASARGGQP